MLAMQKKTKPTNEGQRPLSEVERAVEDHYIETGRPRGMPPLDQVRTEITHQGLAEDDAQQLYDHWLANGFKTGRHAVKDWKAVIRTWKRQGWFRSQKAQDTRAERDIRETMRRMQGGSNAL
jgi:hypothetical protein